MDWKLLDSLNQSFFYPTKNESQFDIPEWTRTFQLASMIFIFGVGLLGNGIITTIQMRQSDKSSTDYIVLTMAFLHLFCCTCVTPFYMAQNIRLVWNIVFSGIFCKVKYFLVYGTNVSSTMLFAALAFDRYMRTCHPFSPKYKRQVTKKICVIIIFVSFTIALFPINVYSNDEGLRDCVKDDGSRVIDLVMSSILTATFVLLFGMALFCYTKITLKIRRMAEEGYLRKIQALPPRRSSNRNFGLFKPNKIDPLPINDSKQSCEEEENPHLKTTSSKALSLVHSQNCCSVPCKGIQDTGCNSLTLKSQFDYKNKYISDGDLTLVQSTSNNLISDENNTPSIIESPTTNTKTQHLMKNVSHSHSQLEKNVVKNLSNGVYKPKYLIKHHQLLQPNNPQLKAQTDQHLQKSEESTQKKQERKEMRKVNYVTFMMFTITATYILSWIITWVMFAIFDQTTFKGRAVLYLTKTFFVVNYIATPIFFCLMSTQFRNRVKKLVSG